MKYLKKFESIEDVKYIVCDRVRNNIDLAFAKEFLEDKRGWNKVTMHDNYADARKELDAGFYDDSDYAVIKIDNDEFFIKRGAEWRKLK